MNSRGEICERNLLSLKIVIISSWVLGMGNWEIDFTLEGAVEISPELSDVMISIPIYCSIHFD